MFNENFKSIFCVGIICFSLLLCGFVKPVNAMPNSLDGSDTVSYTHLRQCTKLMKALFPEKTVEKICRVCSLSHDTFSRFITGQCVEALILGGMFFAVMSIFRFPYALLVGMLIAFTALIPIVEHLSAALSERF